MFALLPVTCRHACRPGALYQARQASSKRWQARQQKDQFTREAAVQGLKSRAAFKLLQVNGAYLILFYQSIYPDTDSAVRSTRNIEFSRVGRQLLTWYANVNRLSPGSDWQLISLDCIGLRTRLMVPGMLCPVLNNWCRHSKLIPQGGCKPHPTVRSSPRCRYHPSPATERSVYNPGQFPRTRNSNLHSRLSPQSRPRQTAPPRPSGRF
jgi:hypothetical protein